MLSFVKDTTGAPQSSKKKNAFENVLAESILLVARAKACSKVLLLFAPLVCASHIFTKRKHVRAWFSKSAFAKSNFARLVCARPYSYLNPCVWKLTLNIISQKYIDNIVRVSYIYLFIYNTLSTHFKLNAFISLTSYLL